MTITHPCHPLHGKKVKVLCVCQDAERQLIIRHPDGLQAYIPMDWTDYPVPQTSGLDPSTDPTHLLDLDGLRRVVQLIDHIRHDGRGNAGPPGDASADEGDAYNEAR